MPRDNAVIWEYGAGKPSRNPVPVCSSTTILTLTVHSTQKAIGIQTKEMRMRASVRLHTQSASQKYTFISASSTMRLVVDKTFFSSHDWVRARAGVYGRLTRAYLHPSTSSYARAHTHTLTHTRIFDELTVDWPVLYRPINSKFVKCQPIKMGFGTRPTQVRFM